MEAVSQLLDEGDKPTAIFSATDEMALGVIHGLQDRGLSVPDDVEVVGFDNTRLARWSDRRLQRLFNRCMILALSPCVCSRNL